MCKNEYYLHLSLAYTGKYYMLVGDVYFYFNDEQNSSRREFDVERKRERERERERDIRNYNIILSHSPPRPFSVAHSRRIYDSHVAVSRDVYSRSLITLY